MPDCADNGTMGSKNSNSTVKRNNRFRRIKNTPVPNIGERRADNNLCMRNSRKGYYPCAFRRDIRYRSVLYATKPTISFDGAAAVFAAHRAVIGTVSHPDRHRDELQRLSFARRPLLLGRRTEPGRRSHHAPRDMKEQHKATPNLTCWMAAIC